MDKKQAVKMECSCGRMIDVPYNCEVSATELGDGNYYEGKCPGCQTMLSAGIYPGPKKSTVKPAPGTKRR